MDLQLKLDLEKIAMARQHLDDAVGPLAFVFDHVGQDMTDRLMENEQPDGHVLCIGFSPFSISPVFKSAEFLTLQSGSLKNLEARQDASLDTIVINLQLAWLEHQAIFQQVHRLLKSGGQILFSTLGPDSLNQIAAAWSVCDEAVHVHEFTDMHHLGDSLVKTGFEKPILDADWLILPFDSPNQLLGDMKREGMHNIHQARRKTCTGKNRFAIFKKEFNRIMQEQGQQAVTLEVIYGYARKPNESTTQAKNRVVVNLPTQR